MPNDAHQLRPSGPFGSDIPSDVFSSLQEIESKAEHLSRFLRQWDTLDSPWGSERDLDKPEFKRLLWDLRNAIKSSSMARSNTLIPCSPRPEATKVCP